jgi:hypothetical protein
MPASMQTATDKRRPIIASLQHLCDLPETIHPILARENWLDMDVNVRGDNTLWNNLQPALRFVTQMLTNEAALLWWTHLFYGETKLEEESKETYLAETSWSWNRDALLVVRQHLSQTIAGQIKFTFYKADESEYGKTFSSWTEIIETLDPSVSPEEKKYLFQKQYVGELVMSAFRSEFKDYFIHGNRSLQQDLSTSFLLGVTIIHEIAHAVNQLHGNAAFTRGVQSRGPCDNDIIEPCFSRVEALDPTYPHKRNELGWSLESYLFGLGFGATMMPEHGASDLWHSSMDALRDPQENVMPTPQKSVLRFFQREKWERLRRTDRVDLKGWPQAKLCVQHRHDFGEGCVFHLEPNAALSEHSDGLFNLTTFSEVRSLLPISCFGHQAFVTLTSRLKPQREHR